MRRALAVLALLLLPVLPAATAHAAPTDDVRGSITATAESYSWVGKTEAIYYLFLIKGQSVKAVLRKLGGVNTRIEDWTMAKAQGYSERHQGRKAYQPLAQVEKRGDLVVAFVPCQFVTGPIMERLSRRGQVVRLDVVGIEAIYNISVARRGKVIRDFEPLLEDNGSPYALPEEKGLDYEAPGFQPLPTCFALAERLTRVRFTAEWSTATHPTYFLRRGVLDSLIAPTLPIP